MNWPIFEIEQRIFYFSPAMQYKHSGTFANRKYEELPFPQKSENVRPHSAANPH